MSVVKPNLGPHSRQAYNTLTFQQAFAQASATPRRVYHTTGNQTPFTVHATQGQKGTQANTLVLKFITDGVERARAYNSCWGGAAQTVTTPT